MTSWKTSTVSVSTLVVALGGVVKQLFDGDPSTNPDWNVVVPLIIATLTGFFARDNDKTSEDVGATTGPK